MPRPYWSGQIQISLVSFGVKLFVATEAKSEIRFHQISRSTGERVRYQKVQASAAEEQESTGADTAAESRVGKDDIVKGYEYQKGQYVTIEPEELAHLRVASKHTVAIEQFVDLHQLPPEYLDRPYYITPESDAQTEAFATVREALRKTKKAAIGKIAFGGREHILAIAPTEEPEAGGLMGFTLRYRDEIRKPGEFFADIKKVPIAEESLDLATELIRRKSAPFDPSTFVDSYEMAVKELVEAKVQNAPVPRDEPVEPTRGKVVNLMDALRKSVSGGEGRAAAAPERSGGGARRAAPAAAKSASGTEPAGISLVEPKARKGPKPAAGKPGAKTASKRRSA